MNVYTKEKLSQTTRSAKLPMRAIQLLSIIAMMFILSPFARAIENIPPRPTEEVKRAIPGGRANAEEDVPPINLPAGCTLDGQTITFVYNTNMHVPQDYERQLVQRLEMFFSNIFVKAGLRVRNANMADLLGGNNRRVMTEREPGLETEFQKMVMSVNSDLVFLYYVDFQSRGIMEDDPEFFTVQDTVSFELYRTSNGERVASNAFTGAGFANIVNNDVIGAMQQAHNQNMERLVSWVDGDLGNQVLDAIERYCDHLQTGDYMTVGLYYQGTDPLEYQMMLKKTIQNEHLSNDGRVRTKSNVNSNETEESYYEFEFPCSFPISEIETTLFTDYIKANGYNDQFRVSFDSLGSNLIVVNLLQEGRPEFSAATRDRLLGRVSLEPGRDRIPLKAFEIRTLAEQAAVKIIPAGGTGVPVAGVLVTYSGYVMTESGNISGSQAFIVKFLNDDQGYEAELVIEDATRKVALLKILNPDYPANVAPLPLGDSDKVQQSDKVYIAMPTSKAFVSLMTTQGEILKVQRGSADGIITSIPVNEQSNGAPLINEHGELVGICRQALRSDALEQLEETSADREATEVIKRRNGTAVPANILMDWVDPNEIRAARRQPVDPARAPGLPSRQY